MRCNAMQYNAVRCHKHAQHVRAKQCNTTTTEHSIVREHRQEHRQVRGGAIGTSVRTPIWYGCAVRANATPREPITDICVSATTVQEALDIDIGYPTLTVTHVTAGAPNRCSEQNTCDAFDTPLHVYLGTSTYVCICTTRAISILYPFSTFDLTPDSPCKPKTPASRVSIILSQSPIPTCFTALYEPMTGYIHEYNEPVDRHRQQKCAPEAEKYSMYVPPSYAESGFKTSPHGSRALRHLDLTTTDAMQTQTGSLSHVTDYCSVQLWLHLRLAAVWTK